jgi:hypothetical protein
MASIAYTATPNIANPTTPPDEHLGQAPLGSEYAELYNQKETIHLDKQVTKDIKK